MTLIRTVLFTLCFLLTCPALVSQAATGASETPQSTSAAPAPTAPAAQAPAAPKASFDDKVQREAEDRVRRAEGELTYLGAAYAAAFLILGIFLWSTRRGQQRLADEVQELQARLDEALTSKPGSDA